MSQRENLPKSDQDLAAPDAETSDTTLKRGTLGLFGVIFFVVAASAPLAGMTGAFPVAVAIGNGAAAAGMYVLVGLILLIFSVGYATMSHYVTNTGAFFAYVGRGLGIVPGVGSAFVSVLAYLTVQWAVIGFIAFQIKLQFEAKFNIVAEWWVYALILIVIVYVLSVLSVDIGAKFLGVLLVIELLALITVGFAAIADGGPEGPNFAASFNPSEILAGGLFGGAGIAFAFALASFIGFEATAIYGEESKDPKRTVPRATYISVILITVIFAFVGFGLVTGLGATDISTKVFGVTGDLADPSGMLFGLTTQFVGSWLTELFGWIVLTSLFAAMLAFQNSAARYLFAMGRAGVLPKRLDHTNKQHAPLTATSVVTVLAVLLVIAGIIFNWDPILNIFYWFSSVSVLAIVLTEILVSLAVVAYFRRTREDTRLWNTMIAPILAAVLLALGEIALVSRFNLLAGVASGEGGPFEMNGLGWFLVSLPLIVLVIGLVVGAIRRGKENYDAVHNFVS